MVRTRILLLTFRVIISLVVLQTNGSQETEEGRELVYYEELIKILQSDANLVNLLPKDFEVEPEVTNEIVTEAEENGWTIKEERNNATDGSIEFKAKKGEENTRYNESSEHVILENISAGTEEIRVKKPRDMDVLDYPLMLSIYMESLIACMSEANSTDISSVFSVLSKN